MTTSPCAPVLVDLLVDSTPVKALAQPTKQSVLYVLDRRQASQFGPSLSSLCHRAMYLACGTPLRSRHQSKPVLRTESLNKDELLDYTPALHAEALALASDLPR